MNRNTLYYGFAMGVTILAVSVTLGCASLRVPLSPSQVTMPDENHGLLLGKIHLTRDRKSPSEGLAWPKDMQWWVENEATRTRLIIAYLPVDGPFVVQLPVGSYRVTDISLAGTRGNWHTVLPTTFTIRSRECTALGTLDLEMQTGFFTGWMTQQVMHEEGIAPDELGGIYGAKGCPTLVAPLETPVKSVVRKHFPTRGAARF
ncbi:MAG: hypothetical protein MRJ66_17545 [Nitrospira sp.]|nr:hypothetical protein [Nitrospira sp.]